MMQNTRLFYVSSSFTDIEKPSVRGGGTELFFSIIVCIYRDFFNKNNSYQKLLNWFENESCLIYLSVLSKQLKLLNLIPDGEQ